MAVEFTGPGKLIIQPSPAAKIPTAELPIRWMIRRDLPEVLSIESASFDFCWCEDDFIRVLRCRNCIGMVVEYRERVVGFMIYELHRNRLHVLNFAVHPDFRRSGVGRALVRKLASKLSNDRRNKIFLEVRETNLPAQKFFRECGFRAVSILRGFYEETGEDGYQMQLRHGEFRDACECVGILTRLKPAAG